MNQPLQQFGPNRKQTGLLICYHYADLSVGQLIFRSMIVLCVPFLVRVTGRGNVRQVRLSIVSTISTMS